MTSILGDQGDGHFSYPPAAMKKEASPPTTKAESAGDNPNPGSGEHAGSKDLPQKVRGMVIHQVPTLSIDDTTIKGKDEQNVGIGSNRTTLFSDGSTDTDDSLSRISTIAEIEKLDPQHLPPFRPLKPHANTVYEVGHKGQAHDPLEDHLYLYVGPSTYSGVSSQGNDDDTFMPDEDGPPIVSESPGAADVDIFETAYRDEIERLAAQAMEQNKEPNVYLTRRVDERLIAISGLAGKWAAKGEEAKSQLKEYTQFSARKARVTEVSRALRQAAREEYERRKQERKELIAKEKAERAKNKEGAQESSKSTTASPTGTAEGDVEQASASPWSPSKQTSALWKGKAVDAGRSAKTSIRGLMDMVKTKNRPQSSQDEG